MVWSRRAFLKLVLLLSGAQLGGCLGSSGSEEPVATQPASEGTMRQGAPPEPAPTTPERTPTQVAPTPTAPAQQAQNSGPVWDATPTIQFVEGVPAVVSVRQFVRDPNLDPLVIQLRSGALVPGMTWNPVDGTIVYDGRPLGATERTPILVSGVTFVADDGRN